MKNFFKTQSQFELFPGTEGAAPKREKSDFFPRHFRLSFENVIVTSIAVILGIIVAFSFGVEKGRKIYVKKVKSKGVVAGPLQRAVPVVQPQVVLSEEDKMSEATASLIETGPELIDRMELASAEDETAAVSEKIVDKTAPMGKIHTIQLASFKRQDQADALAEKLKKEGYDAFTLKKGNYYIVCAGHFADKQEAKKVSGVLKKRYRDCYIRSL
ncbi:MAG TPA: SPOR domain-containing protein [Candidatus Bathyarchaeia archaeon]|nr:SPOR domain-containing protein [Candidatus Bathyarchaeia archaeon]